MKKKKPTKQKPKTTTVRLDRLVDLVMLASQMAADLEDFGSENASKYNKALDKWRPR